jgi:hypothetical protein
MTNDSSTTLADEAKRVQDTASDGGATSGATGQSGTAQSDAQPTWGATSGATGQSGTAQSDAQPSGGATGLSATAGDTTSALPAQGGSHDEAAKSEGGHPGSAEAGTAFAQDVAQQPRESAPHYTGQSGVLGGISASNDTTVAPIETFNPSTTHLDKIPAVGNMSATPGSG